MCRKAWIESIWSKLIKCLHSRSTLQIQPFPRSLLWEQVKKIIFSTKCPLRLPPPSLVVCEYFVIVCKYFLYIYVFIYIYMFLKPNFFFILLHFAFLLDRGSLAETSVKSVFYILPYKGAKLYSPVILPHRPA